jgi:hypothetical protein
MRRPHEGSTAGFREFARAKQGVCFGRHFIVGAVAVVHTASMVVVAGAIAWIFFRYVGIALLQRVWFNACRKADQ